MAISTGKIDLHMHSTVSDGTDSPRELLDKIREGGFAAFSVTDHDASLAGPILRGLLREGDPLFIQGAEFSSRDEKGKYHILGYGFDPEGEAAENLIRRGHELRMKKVLARLNYLKDTFHFDFPEEEIAQLLALDNPGKPHIANMMVRHGYAESKEIAIKDFIDGIRFKSEYLRPEEAIAGILGSGGIPVLAHPFFGSGDELILGEEMEERLTRLKDFGLRGIEAFYSGFSAKLRDTALRLADTFDLLVTAGSDYHGKNKMVWLGDTGLENYGAFPDRLIRFLEEVSDREAPAV